MSSVPLAWHDDLLVGNEEMDRQHRALVAAAVELQETIASNAPQVKSRCAALLECARRHFTSEEGLMLASGYPEYDAHRHEHQQLLNQLAFIHQNVAVGAAGDLMLTVLTAWTVPHIHFADKAFAVFLESR